MTEPLNFKPAFSTSSSFNPATTALNEGALTVLTDTQDLYVDTDDIRIKVSDIVTGTYNSIVGLVAPLQNKIYFATDTKMIWLDAYVTKTDTNEKVLDRLLMGNGTGGGGGNTGFLYANADFSAGSLEQEDLD